LATTSSGSSGLFGSNAEDDLYERAAAKFHNESGPESPEFTGQETGVQLPPFCLVTQDLPPMTLNLPKVVGVGSAVPSSTARPSVQSGTRPLPIPAGRLRDRQLKEVKEGVLRHNQECREVQDRLNLERQRLHRVAVRYGLSTNLWTAIILMIPILLHEVGPVKGFQVYDCSHDQLKTQTIDLT
jgi:hypothetical protein